MNEHDFDDCLCPAGVVERTENTIKAGFIFLISVAAVGFIKLIMGAVEAVSYAIKSVDWLSVSTITLTIIVGVGVFIAILLLAHATWYDWKHERKAPAPLTWIQRGGKELYIIALQIASRIQYRKGLKKRPEFVEMSWEEIILEQSHHPVLDQVTDPEILMALMSVYLNEVERIPERELV